MAPRACGETFSGSVTGTLVTLTNYHPMSPRKSWHHCAMLCLGEGSTRARSNCLDLHCSFEALVNAEYRGRDHLDFAARNYVENVRREETGIAGITYEQALQNLVVAMYGHYVDLFHCHTTTAGHRMVLTYNCLEVAAKLGHYHRAIQRLQPGRSCPIGSPHQRFRLGTPDLITWTPSPCWGMLCILPSGTQRCWPGPATMSIMRAERWGTCHSEGRSP